MSSLPQQSQSSTIQKNGHKVDNPKLSVFGEIMNKSWLCKLNSNNGKTVFLSTYTQIEKVNLCNENETSSDSNSDNNNNNSSTTKKDKTEDMDIAKLIQTTDIKLVFSNFRKSSSTTIGGGDGSVYPSSSARTITTLATLDNVEYISIVFDGIVVASGEPLYKTTKKGSVYIMLNSIPGCIKIETNIDQQSKALINKVEFFAHSTELTNVCVMAGDILNTATPVTQYNKRKKH